MSGADLIHLLLPEYRQSLPPCFHGRVRIIPVALSGQTSAILKPLNLREKVIVSLGGLNKNKQIDLLVRAFEKIAPCFPDWKLNIWGVGSYDVILDSLINQCAAAPRISRLGFAPDALHALQTGQIYCIPSRSEGMPMTLLEAMNCGLPSVGFGSCSGVNTLIQHGKNGLLASEMSVESLAEQLAALMHDPQKREYMGQEAVCLARPYQPGIVFAKWEQLIVEAAGRKGHTAMDAFQEEPFASRARLSAAARREYLFRDFGMPMPGSWPDYKVRLTTMAQRLTAVVQKTFLSYKRKLISTHAYRYIDILKRKSYKIFYNVTVGEWCRIEGKDVFIGSKNGNITLGNGCILRDQVRIVNEGADITLGNSVIVEPFSIIYGHAHVNIGDNTLIGPHTIIIPANHRFSRMDIPISNQGLQTSAVTIGNNVWIGANCSILRGVTIGDGAVIGAGSVVTSAIPANAVAYGSPARPVKKRHHSPLSLHDFRNSKDVRMVYRQACVEYPQLLAEICKLAPDMFPGVDTREERGLPGDPVFQKSGHCHTMLARYFWAASSFGRGAQVLELGSGLGWGAYILAHYAEKVCCIERDTLSVDICRRLWTNVNIQWQVGDIPAVLSRYPDASFNLITCMEFIEHLTWDVAATLLGEIARLLRPGGHVIFSSVFPLSRQKAETVGATNAHHMHIFTSREMYSLGARYFVEMTIIANQLFIGRK